MLGPSHATIGAATGVVLGHLVGAEAHMASVLPSQLPHAVTGAAGLIGMALACGSLGAVAALLPDADTPSSTFGLLLPRWWHELTPGHRGVTHSALWVVLCWAFTTGACAGLGIAGPGAKLLPLLVAAGVASHLAADAMTDHGICLLWPLPWHVGLPLFTTGTWPERVVVSGVVALTAWWVLGLGHLVHGGAA